MSTERNIYAILMRATETGSVPDGYYGPQTCRWGTPDEMRRFGLKARPLVHLDANGQIDCYFTKNEAVVVRPKRERMH
jgi:hypothetical protein